eukprot:EG_transcript_16124
MGNICIQFQQYRELSSEAQNYDEPKKVKRKICFQKSNRCCLLLQLGGKICRKKGLLEIIRVNTTQSNRLCTGNSQKDEKIFQSLSTGLKKMPLLQHPRQCVSKVIGSFHGELLLITVKRSLGGKKLAFFQEPPHCCL